MLYWGTKMQKRHYKEESKELTVDILGVVLDPTNREYLAKRD